MFFIDVVLCYFFPLLLSYGYCVLYIERMNTVCILQNEIARFDDDFKLDWHITFNLQ